MEREGKSISVNGKGFMFLPEASEGDAGNYTCLVDVMLDGKNYTAARSIQLVIRNGAFKQSLQFECIIPAV